MAFLYLDSTKRKRINDMIKSKQNEKRIFDKEACFSKKILFYFFVLNEEFLSVTKYINGREEKKVSPFFPLFILSQVPPSFEIASQNPHKMAPIRF